MTVSHEVECGWTGLVILQQFDIRDNEHSHHCQCDEIPSHIASPSYTHFGLHWAKTRLYHKCYVNPLLFYPNCMLNNTQVMSIFPKSQKNDSSISYRSLWNGQFVPGFIRSCAYITRIRCLFAILTAFSYIEGRRSASWIKLNPLIDNLSIHFIFLNIMSKVYYTYYKHLQYESGISCKLWGFFSHLQNSFAWKINNVNMF